MALGIDENNELQVSTFENNETFADEQDLLSNAANNEAHHENDVEEIHEVINKSIAEDNTQQNDNNNKAIKLQTENKNLDKQPEGFVKNNLNAEVTPNTETNEDSKQSKLELINENLKNVNMEAYGDADEKREEKRTSRRSSHYLQNIQMTNSSLGLSLGSEKKDTTLLTEPKTVARFSPLWKQVIFLFLGLLLFSQQFYDNGVKNY